MAAFTPAFVLAIYWRKKPEFHRRLIVLPQVWSITPIAECSTLRTLTRYNALAEQGHVRRWYASATEIESRKQEEERVRNENVRLEERTRIAQELHDTLLQTFISASMMLNVVVDDAIPVTRPDHLK
jgi:signal transduction histidine kinase